MAITFVGAETAGSNNEDPDAGVTCSVPSGTQDGDFMIAVVASSGINDENPDLEAGWTELFDESTSSGSVARASLQYRVASSEPANYTFTWTGTPASTTDDLRVSIVVFRDVATTPWDVTYVSGTHRTEYENDNTPTFDSITTVTDGAFVLAITSIGTAAGGTATSLSGYSEAVDEPATGGRQTFHYAEKATAGVESPGTLTMTGAGAGADLQTFTLALRPASASSAGVGKLVNGGLVR